MNKIIATVFFAMTLFTAVQCSHSPEYAYLGAANEQRMPTASVHWLDALEKELVKTAAQKIEFKENVAAYHEEILERVSSALKKAKSKDEPDPIADRITQYVAIVLMGYDKNNEKTAAKTRETKKKAVIKRIFDSSVQYIMCEDLADFECLEKTPALKQSQANRAEDPASKLGEAKIINDSLEKSVEWFFTEQIHMPEDQVDLNKTLAKKLADKINTEAKDGLYMAVYGVDDVDSENGRQSSMKPVYDAIMKKIKDKVDVKAVLDQKGLGRDVSSVVVSYVKPSGAKLKDWMLTPLEDNKTNMNFQYNGGTQGIIAALAEGAKKEEDARGRIEWKNDGIMHNKFMVMKNGNKLAVWTGTANVARTCMGTDRNSNMGLFIKNNEIAETFLDEFEEMYEFSAKDKNEKYKGATAEGFPHGKFHGGKTANTHRLFHFKQDQSDAKVYFSPTDDAEHRAILPMLLSAQDGDKLRVSMFGGAGVEYVRAMQIAAARGATVEVIIDSPTGFSPGGWAACNSDATLFEDNPYSKDSKITFKKNKRGPGSAWKQNHQKIGLLLRKKGNRHIAEQLIVGSQNWSASGNDKNDENLVAFRNVNTGLKVGEGFDKHFNDVLWSKASTIIDCKTADEAGDEGEE